MYTSNRRHNQMSAVSQKIDSLRCIYGFGGAIMEVVQSIVDSPRCIYGFGGAFMEVVQLWRCYQYRLVHRHLVQCAFMEVVHLWM